MKLSKRLLAVAEMVTPGMVVTDIGTDHGYVPIYLVENNICPSAIAMDVNQGPILRAESHILDAGLEDKIQIRLSNGFENIKPGEADCAVIAGMGGELMVKILENGRAVVDKLKEMVLSPHSEIFLVRQCVHEMGLLIADEKMVFDEGKYYTIIKVKSGNEEKYSEIENKYGRILIEKKDPVFVEYINREKSKIENIIEKIESDGGGNSSERLGELKRNLMELNVIL